LDHVGYLPEERGLYKKMQVRRLLRFMAELKGVPAREADRRINSWLDRLSLRDEKKDWGNSKLDELSRGMQQKVQFIATLLHEPDLVILDEPFSGLDPINAQALKDTIVDLRRQGRTVIFSTHIMDNAERMCDSVCIISRGEKVLDGTMSGVRSQDGATHIALGVDTGSDEVVRRILASPGLVARADDSNRTFEIELAHNASSSELLKRLVEAGVGVTRFELVQPSLHQIFLERVGARGIEDGVTGNG
jgi:ABC-2 type transport system ATP-binding protein